MVSVIIPALNESARIAGVVALARQSTLVTEVIVVDDGSVDSTPELASAAGARVITSSLLGKGASMEDGLKAAVNSIVVYLDGDLTGLREDLIDILVQPLINGQADFVKACFSRKAGRVTTLTAKPLLQLFFPEMAHFVQPLGGIMAAKASVLNQLQFETDYGVDLALLIDAHMLGARIVEVDIGHLEHDSQSLEALGEMSKQVVRALLHRADRHERLSVSQIREVEEVERHARAEFGIITQATQRPHRLAIFDMDGTLLQGRFAVELARYLGRLDQLHQFLDNPALGTEERSNGILGVFRGVPKTVFEKVARNVELTPGAIKTIVQLRKWGFTVGIVSDSYRVAADIIRRRVFADFSVANIIRFEDGLATTKLTLSPLLRHTNCHPDHELCKQNTVLHLLERFGLTNDQVLAVGDGLNDARMLAAAGLSVAFEPKADLVRQSAQHTITGDLTQILDLVEAKGWGVSPLLALAATS